MKTPQILACLLVLSWASAACAADPIPAATPSPELTELLNDGKAAYAKGDIQKAKENFEMVYQMDSRNQVAIAYLRRIKSEEKYSPKTVDQEKALQAIIIPKVEFHDATLREALESLRKKVVDLTSGKQTANFVVPSGEPTDSTRVTLSLQNVPFPEAVRYVGKVANFEFKFEKYAIVGKPGAGADPTPSIAPAAKTTTQ